MLHTTARTPLVSRRIEVEHESENDGTARMQNNPGNKEAIYASERKYLQNFILHKSTSFTWKNSST